MKDRARLVGQALEDTARYRAKRHVVITGRAADHQQNTDFAGDGVGAPLWTLRRVGVRPHERSGAQGERHIGNRVAQQFPRDGVSIIDASDDFDTGVIERPTQDRPKVTSVVAAAEYGFKQFGAQLDQSRLDAMGDDRRRVERMREIILQIPAHIALILGGQGEGELARGGLAREAVAFQRDFGAIAILGQADLGEAKQ